LTSSFFFLVADFFALFAKHLNGPKPRRAETILPDTGLLLLKASCLFKQGFLLFSCAIFSRDLVVELVLFIITGNVIFFFSYFSSFFPKIKTDIALQSRAGFWRTL